MTESLKIIATRLHLDMTGIHVWLDILSITQQKQIQVSSLDTREAGVVLLQKLCQQNVHHDGEFL